MRRARHRVTVIFAVQGAVVGVFATRILWIQERLHLSPTALGAALVVPAVSACFTMPLAGRVTRWLGARRAVWGLTALFAGCLVLPVLAPSVPLLWLALLLLGGAGGIADVVMNANGSEVERLYGRSIMSGLHASWSVGALAGSALGALGVYAGMDPRAQFAVIGLALVAVSAWAGRGLLDPRPGPNEGPSARFALPERAVLAIGMVAFCAQFAEGAAATWSAVYLRSVVDASAAVATLSLSVFTLAMLIMRLFGDLITRRWGPVRTTAGCGVLAVLGCALLTVARNAAMAMTGIALLGIGIAVILPLAFAAAGRRGGDVNRSVASVATITYLSNLIAPIAVGAIAGASSLPVSFGLITVLLAGMTVGARAFRAAPGTGTPGGPAAEPESAGVTSQG